MGRVIAIFALLVGHAGLLRSQEQQTFIELPQRPLLVSAAMPLYPTLAIIANQQGQVTVEGTLQGGRVVDTRIVSGDRALLERPSTENLETWRFDTGIPVDGTTITVTYSYSIEGVGTEYPESASVEIDLEKWRVNVRARPYGPLVVSSP